MSLKIQLNPIEKNEQKKVFKDLNCVDIDNNPSVVDKQAIEKRIQNLFNWSQGQRILLPTFGNILEKIKYEPLNEVTLKNAESQIRLMFSFEPEVRIIEPITLEPNPDRNELYIRVDYAIPSLEVKSSTELTVQVVEQ